MADPIIIKVYQDGQLVREFIKLPDPEPTWHLYLGAVLGVLGAFILFA